MTSLPWLSWKKIKSRWMADAGEQKSIDKRITVVCVSYRRYKNIPILIHSFLAQTLQNFRLHIIHDGYDKQMHNLLKKFKAQYPDIIDYEFTQKRYNDYGHTLRDIGIQKANTDYILITNDDNYYCPKFLEYMFDCVNVHNADIVMCDMIHSHDRPGGRNLPPYSFFETRPARLSVDIGCFIAKSDLAKKVGFRDKTHDGDASYFEDLVSLRPTPTIVKMPRVLFVHN